MVWTDLTLSKHWKLYDAEMMYEVPMGVFKERFPVVTLPCQRLEIRKIAPIWPFIFYQSDLQRQRRKLVPFDKVVI